MLRANTNPHIVSLLLKRNGYFPNSALPVLVYRQVLQLPDQRNRAAGIVQKLVLSHGWANTWRNGIYDFHHYHSNTHECMAVCAGQANVIVGGPNGRRLVLQKGDVILLPAGTGHRCTVKSDDFLVVGAYPQGKDYDTNTGTAEEYAKALKMLSRVPIPKHDPLFGKQGFLKAYWK